MGSSRVVSCGVMTLSISICESLGLTTSIAEVIAERTNPTTNSLRLLPMYFQSHFNCNKKHTPSTQALFRYHEMINLLFSFFYP